MRAFAELDRLYVLVSHEDDSVCDEVKQIIVGAGHVAHVVSADALSVWNGNIPSLILPSCARMTLRVKVHVHLG